MTRVMVVEDEPAIAELISMNLRHAGYQVRVAADSGAATESVRTALPDLVVLDWMIPGESGIVLLKRWRSEARTREMPVVMLTARSLEGDTVTGLDAGADDYLSKPFLPSVLLARVRAVLRRRLSEASNVPIAAGPLTLDPGTHRIHCHGGEIKVGLTEFKLLRFFMSYPERVHSRSQILDRVWGDHVFIEERTVDVHIKRLRDSLGAVNCAGMVETVRGAGYRLTVRPTDVAT